MGTLTAKQYSIILIVQYLTLIFDVTINSYANFSRQNPIDLLVLYVMQDFCLILALTILLVTFFSTYIFQAGLIQLLYTRFRMTLVLCIIYLILSISLHTWHITIYWSLPLYNYWSRGFHVLYSMHRTVAVFYYYVYKRAALRIGDPRFYEGSTWVQKEISLP